MAAGYCLTSTTFRERERGGERERENGCGSGGKTDFDKDSDKRHEKRNLFSGVKSLDCHMFIRSSFKTLSVYELSSLVN